MLRAPGVRVPASASGILGPEAEGMNNVMFLNLLGSTLTDPPITIVVGSLLCTLKLSDTLAAVK